MSHIKTLIGLARDHGASDLHLEGGLPVAIRVRGSLRTMGEPISPKVLMEIAHDLITPENWPVFLEKRSYDLSQNIAGVRCRINIMQTSRGAGLAIRLLASFQATLDKLNLHPDLKKFVTYDNGLVLLCGPTGCGKSSTLAALIQEINLSETRHIVTIESPIEYTFKPKRSYIRQREVGRDTPSVEQALIDALREDPDVLMVGEMRDPETMRLTLNAAETGHLVFATVHSSTCVEALQRIIAAFPSEIQSGVSAQLADCLLGVISQRLQYRSDLKIRVPECEILTATHPVKNFIRTREFFKIASVIETGAEHGMWTFQRYRSWLEKRSNWYIPHLNQETLEADSADTTPAMPALPRPSAPVPSKPASSSPTPARPTSYAGNAGRIEIEPVEGGLGELLKGLE